MQAAEYLLQREEMTVSGCRSVKVFSRREDCCFSEGLLYSKKGKRSGGIPERLRERRMWRQNPPRFKKNSRVAKAEPAKNRFPSVMGQEKRRQFSEESAACRLFCRPVNRASGPEGPSIRITAPGS